MTNAVEIRGLHKIFKDLDVLKGIDLAIRPGEAAAYDILCDRSFAEYLWLWLEDAAAEFTAGG